MRLVRLLPERARGLAPEALRFGAVGLANTVLYFLIFNVTMGIGAVKATVIATIVTTTLSYLANRHWTYKNRPKNDLRREYVLFFAFNLAGMVIQSGVVAIGKYGLDLNEDKDRLALNIATCVGIGLATLFRFWTYRTLVFRPATQVEPTVTATAPTARRVAVGKDTSDLVEVPVNVEVPAAVDALTAASDGCDGATAPEHPAAAVSIPVAPQPRTGRKTTLPEHDLDLLGDTLDAEFALATAELDRARRRSSASPSV